MMLPSCSYVKDTPKGDPLSPDEQVDLIALRDQVDLQNERDLERIAERASRQRNTDLAGAVLGGLLLLGVVGAAASAGGSVSSSGSGGEEKVKPAAPCIESVRPYTSLDVKIRDELNGEKSTCKKVTCGSGEWGVTCMNKKGRWAYTTSMLQIISETRKDLKRAAKNICECED